MRVGEDMRGALHKRNTLQSHRGEKVKGADYRKFLEAVELRVWSLRTPCRPHEWILASSEVLLVEWR